jgi:hypothetical protein
LFGSEYLLDLGEVVDFVLIGNANPVTKYHPVLGYTKKNSSRRKNFLFKREMFFRLGGLQGIFHDLFGSRGLMWRAIAHGAPACPLFAIAAVPNLG